MNAKMQENPVCGVDETYPPFTCPECGGREFKVDSAVSATDYIVFTDDAPDSDPSEYYVADQGLFDSEWRDGKAWECEQCGRRTDWDELERKKPKCYYVQGKDWDDVEEEYADLSKACELIENFAANEIAAEDGQVFDSEGTQYSIDVTVHLVPILED